MDKPLDRALVWFRRDLRTDDHAALYHALRAARQVWCVFVFDRGILEALPRQDRRVEFIRDSLVGLDAQLRALGGSHGVEGVGLAVVHGHAVHEIAGLASRLAVQAVYASHDDDPYALQRDAKARGALADIGVALHTSKDHVVFERSELLSPGGTPYRVFTPYRNAWLKKLDDGALQPYPVAHQAGALAPLPEALAAADVPSLAQIGFEPSNLHLLKLPSGSAGAIELLDDFLDERIGRYHDSRDYPAVKGPSYLGPHLRFGTVSVRHLVREAHRRQHSPDESRGAQVWLSELIWREFYHQILHHHPHVVGHAFRPECERIRWEHGKHADALFAAWAAGRTGYPLVDAAMHQINSSGYMHNRLRMLSASFLVKDLGIDWRRGEAYFAEKLNDYELASNNGGWQWAASTGTDAQPWFRIFNPVTQSRKFDAEGKFIRRYLPQLAALPDAWIHEPWRAPPAELAAAKVVLGGNYPAPVVEHAAARERTLQRFAAIRGSVPPR
jgi:deoxyribodipyrimidine photo-lyase